MSIYEITITQRPYTSNIKYNSEESISVSYPNVERDKFVQRRASADFNRTIDNENQTKGIPSEQFDTLKRISAQYEALMNSEGARELSDFLSDDGIITDDGRAVFVTPFEIPYKGVLYTTSKVVEYDELGRPITVAINNSTEQKIIKYDYWSATVRRTEEKYEIVETDDSIIPMSISIESKF